MKNAPNFEAWNQALLAQYAIEQYQENIRLREALEQVRLDLKDVMKLLREQVISPLRPIDTDNKSR